MIVNCIYVTVKSDCIHDFIAASEENHFESVKEAGNLRFDICQMADDPCRFLLYEAYETVDSAVAHKSTPQYIKWRDTVNDMMAEPRKGIRYNILQPKK